jgi:hypothetical protein
VYGGGEHQQAFIPSAAGMRGICVIIFYNFCFDISYDNEIELIV